MNQTVKNILIGAVPFLFLPLVIQAASIFDFAGVDHSTGSRKNNWADSTTWENGPAAFPNAPGAVVRTSKEIRGDVDLYLNRDITIGSFNWFGNQLYVYPGSPAGKLIVDNNGPRAHWDIITYYGFRLNCDMVLHSSVIISNWSRSSLQFGGRISGKGGLHVIWHQNRIRAGDECIFGSNPADPLNTYTGGTYLQAVNPGKKGLFRARKNGAFGTGPVKLNANATLILDDTGDRDDMIADTTALYLTWTKGGKSVVALSAGVNETIAKLFINGKQQFAGTYGASGSGALHENDDFFSGSGILTVAEGGIAPGKVRTTSARDITTSGAVLGGVIEATNAAATRAFMFWGTNNGGMDRRAWQHQVDLGVCGPGPVSAKIAGRKPLEKLFYRCCITNNSGIIWASPVEMVKLNGPPELHNEFPALRRDYVSLRGRLAATNGFSTTVLVFWGAEDGGTDPRRWQYQANFGTVNAGLISTNLLQLKGDARYFYRFQAVNKAGTAWASETTSFTAPGALSVNDITFFSVSDTHYEADPEENALRREGIERMNTIPGIPYPDSHGAGRVDVPRGVLALGDLIDDGAVNEFRYVQWAQWTNDFGVNGECTVKFPVYEGYGNHDLHRDRYVNEQIKARTARRKDITAVSPNGYHYSWDWDQLHVVNLNLFPGNVHKTPNFGPVHDPAYALDFLKKDLAENVGDSGRPVIIGHHYDPRDTWWTETQKSNYFNAVTNYNVICIIHGHTGTGIYTWRGLDIVNDGNFPSSIFVFHITPERLYVVQRTKENEWGITLSKPITFPAKP